MFLLSPEIFLWDAVILLLIAIPSSGALMFAFWAMHHSKRSSALWAKIASATLILCAASIFYAAFVEPQLLVVTKHSITHPFAQPLSIAVISDLHVGPYKQQDDVEQIVRVTNNQLPDMVLLAGDFIFGPKSSLEDLIPLADLRAPLGVFAVLGNHDEGQYSSFFGTPVEILDRGDEIAAFLEQIGITVLRNENRAIDMPDGDIVIAGVDDYMTGHSSVTQALQDVPKGVFSILLSHNPSVITDETSMNAHLIISGHTHGGQVRLPGIGSLSPLPISIDQSFDQGIFQIDNDTMLAISRGAGESHARLRFFAPPQIMMLNVR